MNTTTFNGIEIPHTPENIEKMKKIVEEFDGGDEMKVGDEYWSKSEMVNVVSGISCIWTGHKIDLYRMNNDNCLPCKKYTQDQATEYFNKRDARRAAETKLRKIIAGMNKKDGFVAKFNGGHNNYYSYYDTSTKQYWVSSNRADNSSPFWRYSSSATAEFINENHADLLDIYLERN